MFIFSFESISPPQITHERWRERKKSIKKYCTPFYDFLFWIFYILRPFLDWALFCVYRKVARAPRTLRYPAKKKPTVVRVFFQFSFSSLCFTPFLSTGYGGPSTFTIVDHIHTAKQQNKNSFSISPHSPNCEESRQTK